MVESVIGSVEYDKAITKETMDENIAPKAPGMKYRHYAPEGCLVIYEGNIQDVATAINNKARLYLEEGKL